MKRKEIIVKLAELIDDLTYIRFMDRLPPRIAEEILKELEKENVINKEVWDK